MYSFSLDKPMLFISDVHLGGFSKDENNRIEAELIELINYCQRGKIRMAVLGDLFDYWMEYPNYVPKLGKKLLDRFESFNKQLGPTLFITGNHDNWTRNHLNDRGFILEHEHADLTLNGKNIMALHGDGLAGAEYQLPRPPMHRLMRSPQFVRLYQKLLSPKTGITIMKYFSRLTRYLDWNQKPNKLNQWAKQQLDQSHFDVIICGHDHIPRKKQFTFGTYINLGNFYQHRTMAYFSEGEFSLVRWDPQKQSLNYLETIINE